jgi:IS30 family transposase
VTTTFRPEGKLNYDDSLWTYVFEEISVEDWTPELVEKRLPLAHPHDPQMRVSYESIYRKIYAQGHHFDLLREELPQGHKKRRKRGQGKHRPKPLHSR